MSKVGDAKNLEILCLMCAGFAICVAPVDQRQPLNWVYLSTQIFCLCRKIGRSTLKFREVQSSW